LFFASRAPIVDIQAKDRLTGAVILVALVVLVVPEILSGPERGTAGAVDPAASAPQMRSYTVDLGDIRRGPESSAAAPANAPASTQSAAAPPAEDTSPAAAMQSAPMESAPEAVAAPPPALTKAPSVAVKPASGAAVKSKPPVRAAPAVALAAKAAPSAPVGHGNWTVQLGTFSNEANAQRLVHELAGKGFAAFSTESSGSGRKLYRVRVGPASDHAAAAALAERLRAAGHPGSLTEHP
jgi:DedD protein